MYGSEFTDGGRKKQRGPTLPSVLCFIIRSILAAASKPVLVL